MPLVPTSRSRAALLVISFAAAACASPSRRDAGCGFDPLDALVPVGDLCVDKYEASVWSAPTGGVQYGSGGRQDYPCGDGPDGTGQGCTPAGKPIYARSVPGVLPSASLTWFQANIACANAGKHLLTNAEWQAAAAGTPDPGDGTPSPPGCNVTSEGPSTTGRHPGCVSGYGAENMVGSVWEWVADWGQYGKLTPERDASWQDMEFTTAMWPGDAYGADASWNVAGRSFNGAEFVEGLPGAVRRGGHWKRGSLAGVFSFNARSGPTDWHERIGFRCGRRR